ncbi:MAG: hypothetical protein J7521_09105 [Caulobacter sp.]|nr:hypothetical protein [Caulobacter sp.]
MRRSLILVPALAAALAASACSRHDDKSDTARQGEPATEAAPVAGGPQTLKPGLWKTVTKTPTGDQETTRCVGEGFDPGAEAAQKASPCGKPTITRQADGFRLEHSCKNNGIDYALTGTVTGDFTTTATTDMTMTLSAFGRRQSLHMTAVSTYVGPCELTTPAPAKG